MRNNKSDLEQALADFFLERLERWHTATHRPLFGAIALCRDGLVFAMVWKGALYLKADEAMQTALVAMGSSALPYRSGGREMALKSYWEIPAETADDDDQLADWAERAWQAARRARGPAIAR